ncbi:MAG: serine/threonine-protein kinase [Candidatus Calescibacterium sp.]|nr:serine/threonine protein kinase [Candidatus Calescibacterium sp.]MCX7972641.1 serine/threonine protein kinase [bacterium]MDW8194762.1 serine/threonine-protein kinase [Candidatus Calescibacterium sp.]
MNNEKTIADKTISIQLKPISVDYKNITKWGNYKVNKILKENNQCVLFIVEDTEGKKYVLKVFYPHSPFSLECISRIKDLSRNSDFPSNLVKIFDYGYSQEHRAYFIIEEYLPLEDLGNYFKTNKLNSKDIRSIVYQLNEGINYLHTNQIIHNDIKPSNILIRSVNPLVIAISDYNIASFKPRDIDIKATSFKLTPAYAAPEKFTNIISEKTDYWSMGITLLELLTGKNPFENIDPNLIAYKILTQGVDIPSDLDPEFKDLLSNLLISNPEQRWGYEQVKAFLEGKKVQTQTQTTQKKELKIKFKNREYKTVEELLLSFLKSQDDFRSGVKFLKTKEFYEILDDKDKEFLANLQREIEDEDLLLNFFISYKFPSLPPYICSRKLSFDSIISTLRKIKNKHFLEYEDKKIIQLIKNYLESKKYNIMDLYNHYKQNHIDNELETFLVNLKRFVLPNHIDDSSMYKLAFTVISIVDKDYYLPEQLINFKINRDLLNTYLPVVGDLLTVEEFNRIRTSIKRDNPYYQRLMALTNSPPETFLPISENLKINLSKILDYRDFSGQNQDLSRQNFIKILTVVNRYLTNYGFRDSELEYYLRNPVHLDRPTFQRIYERNIDVILSRINKPKSGFPFIGFFIWLVLVIISITSVFFSCFICFSSPYYNPILSDFLAICFVSGIVLFILSFFVGGWLMLLQKILGYVRSSRKITREELKRIIEYEARFI